MFTSNSRSINDINAIDILKTELKNRFPDVHITNMYITQEKYSFIISCLNFEDPIVLEYIGKSNSELIEEFSEKVNIWTLMGLRKNVHTLTYDKNSLPDIEYKQVNHHEYKTSPDIHK